MKLNIDLNKAVEDFCKEYGLCPTKEDKIILKLAINKGMLLLIAEDIKYLQSKMKGK